MYSLLILIVLLLAPLAASAQTPALKAVTSAEAQIAQAPEDPHAHSYLARALVKRARETADPGNYTRAESAIDTALSLEPDHFEAQKARVTVLLGRHKYTEALDLAKKLNRRIPDDVAVYGYIADAYMALGDLDQAEKAAQWMLDLRRGSLPGMIRGAMLRARFGDTAGAIDWFTSVYRLTSPGETEERAWLLVQIAGLRRESGALDLAEQLANQALALFPDYYVALDSLAATRDARKEPAIAAR